ncbi:MAG: BamA/TamA family outer membrane protein [Bacteroidota bacterium]
MNRLKTVLIICVIFTSCVSYKPYYDSGGQGFESSGELDHSIVFYGGASEMNTALKKSLDVIKAKANTINENSTLLLLGNNVPKYGLPDSSGHKSRFRAEAVLNANLEVVNNFPGNTFVVPGLNEWAHGRSDGYNRVLLFEEYLEDHAKKENIVVPANACPGPYEYEISDGIVLIVINTQWYLHLNDKPDATTGCNMEDELDYIVQLEDAIRRNRNKKVIVTGYHPMFSNGKYGGHFSAKRHFIPPFFGSLYVWYRSKIGSSKDLKEFKYRSMRSGLRKLFAEHPNLIYLSGHEESLQHHTEGNSNFIVSGSISNNTRVASGEGASFAQGTSGYGKLNFYKSGDVYLEFWSTSGQSSQLTYSRKLFNHIYNPATEDLNRFHSDLDYTGQTKDVIATTKLNKSGKKPGLLGNNYRTEWGLEIKNVPYFDLGTEKGGLEIIKKGGGLQTRSLRLEAQDGRQYGLRSIEKFAEKAVPAALRGTIAGKVVSDQVSASHPYGAFVVPKLAEAAGVYHTNPKLVYLPDDPRLGKYQKDFGDGVYLCEERPAGKAWKDFDDFGNPDEIVSTFEVLEKIKKNDKHQIDEDQVLRSRLFDIWLGDWDRHDDQWRWAKYKLDDDVKLYRPIPRDRDQAFFWSDGTLIKLFSRKWGIPKFQGFHDEIRDVSGLEFNARYFDRTFLVQKDLDDWVKMAKEIQQALTDEVIEDALNDWPEEIYKVNGKVIERKLKKRREDLVKYAQEFYLFLSKRVDILGSKKAELFEVNRLNDEETELKVYRIKEKSGEVKFQFYERVFKRSETKEIRLYGFGDDDRFVLNGDVKKGIRIRMIGGKGDDLIEDNSSVGGLVKKNIVYDVKTDTKIQSSGELKNKTSNRKKEVNKYNRYAFKYDKVSPLLAFGFNADDGIFIGGGASFLKHKFRKDPFAARHNLTIQAAPRSGSYQLNYNGTFNQVFGKWGLEIDGTIAEPSFGDFFYGFGNRTENNEDLTDEDAQFYNARYSQWIFNPSVFRTINNKHKFNLGGFFRTVEISEDNNDEDPNRFIVNYPGIIGRNDLLDNSRNYLGAKIDYTLDLTDSKGFPTSGIKFNFSGKAVIQIDDEENDYQSLSSDLSAYFTLKGSLQTTLAVRVGGAANFGDFEFYQAPRLGGLTNLRGYGRARFTGDESFYQNNDIRIKLFKFRTILSPISVGIIGVYDVGRVWTDNSDIEFVDNDLKDWHQAYGGGIWLSLLGSAVISSDYTVSNDDETGFYIRFGFLF